MLKSTTIAIAALALAGCDLSHDRTPPIGDPTSGIAIVKRQACGSCHRIPGVQVADGLVGPPLTGIGTRVYVAGHLRNTPENMITWLRDPQAVLPGNAMPNMGLSAKDARDVAAYLYTLR